MWPVRVSVVLLDGISGFLFLVFHFTCQGKFEPPPPYKNFQQKASQNWPISKLEVKRMKNIPIPKFVETVHSPKLTFIAVHIKEPFFGMLLPPNFLHITLTGDHNLSEAQSCTPLPPPTFKNLPLITFFLPISYKNNNKLQSYPLQHPTKIKTPVFH